MHRRAATSSRRDLDIYQGLPQLQTQVQLKLLHQSTQIRHVSIVAAMAYLGCDYGTGRAESELYLLRYQVQICKRVVISMKCIEPSL
jgi:hypothetical protein